MEARIIGVTDGDGLMGVPVDQIVVDTRLHTWHPFWGVNYVETTEVLEDGKKYLVTFDGNWATTGLTSTPPIPIKYPSPGFTNAQGSGLDWVGSLTLNTVWIQHGADDTTRYRPNFGPEVVFGGSLSNPIVKQFVTGQGEKLRAATADGNLADNNGLAYITIEATGGWKIGEVGLG